MNSEPHIIDRILRGETEAFAILFRSYYEPLCYFAQRFVEDFDAAEGIVQDVFVRLWETRETMSIHTSERGYLYTAVKNSCLNQIKHSRHSAPLEGKEERPDATALAPDAQLESDEMMHALEAAINDLPPKCREIFRLAKFDSLSYQEIAEIQNVSPNTVKTQLQRALKSLAKALQYLQILLVLLGIAHSSRSPGSDVTLLDNAIVVDVGEKTHEDLP